MREVVAAVDVGGTRIKAALVDRSYDVVAALTVPTPADIARRHRRAVASAVAELLGHRRARDDRTRRAAGRLRRRRPRPGRRATRRRPVVGQPRLAGPADPRRGGRAPAGADRRRARRAGRAAGRDPARGGPRCAGTRCSCRSAPASPARCCSTGVLISADGWAGELGHLVVDPAGPPCACGADRVPGAVGVGGGGRTGVRRDDRPALLGRAGRRPDRRPATRRRAPVWDRAVSALAPAIAATVTLTGVDLVLLGGGLARERRDAAGPAARGRRRPG